MPLEHFTQRWVEGVKPPPTGKQIDYYDKRSFGKGRRFGLRISYRGTKTWCVWYQFEGRTRRLNIGHWPPLGLAEARRKADRELSAILLNSDPAGERQAARHAETVGELATLYIARYAKRHKRSWKRDQEILDRDVLPFWGRRKLTDIRRRDVCVMTDRIVDRGAPIGANRAFAVVSKMFNWAVERDLLEHNPCVGAKKPSAETPRERALTRAEIATFWTRLKQTNISESIQVCLKLLLVSGHRKGDLSQAA
ncbi:MAG: integrase arm-type DNA-binding domain-containing protein [Gammaproteobacteria bacterium]